MIERESLTKNPYEFYPGRPIVLTSTMIGRHDEGVLVVTPNQEILVPHDRHKSIVGMTLDGLLQDVLAGTDLSRRLQEEFTNPYATAVEEADSSGFWVPLFGEPVFYPLSGQLVWYAPRFWHQAALLARNSLLLERRDNKLTWEEQRKIFDNLTVAVAGASVGANVFHSVAQTIRPGRLKVADVKGYQVTNANRIAIGYDDIGEHKAATTASKLHRIDPFVEISVYMEGINPNTLPDFVKGRPELGEPRSDYVIEETDDPNMKIRIREEARNARVPLVMITDIGTGVQIDIRNFRDRPNAPLTFGISDDQLYSLQRRALEHPGNRDCFFDFAFALIGSDWKRIPEFRGLIERRLQSPFAGGVPQLGPTAQTGGAIAALRIAKMSLGFKFHERTFVDLSRLRNVKNEGDLV